MKASDKPQLSQKWWNANRPPDLRTTPLDKALPKAESALATQRKKDDDSDVIDDCLTALEDVLDAAGKTVKQCDKIKHKILIAVLNKYEDVVDDESSRLEALQKKLDANTDEDDEDDEDEADEGKLFDKGYLYKMMKMLKSSGKEFKFGFGLNTSDPATSRLLLKRKGKPEMLFKTLKKTGEFNDRLLTFGYAKADPNDAKTLVLRLEDGAGEPPRVEKLGKKFLCSDKRLKFRKMRVVTAGGKAVADSEPDDNGKVKVNV